MYKVILIFCVLLLHGCGDIWNDPYPRKDAKKAIYYTDFDERPKYLDPAKSYAASESIFIGQIYEPPLQYHYLLRPYQLEPLTASEMPKITYYDANDQVLPVTAPVQDIAYSIYEIKIKPGIKYQFHPAFAKDAQGDFLYHHLNEKQLAEIQTLADFKVQSTREVTAEDYVYQIKRLAQPAINSPILDLMKKHIVGLEDFSNHLFAEFNQLPQDLREIGYLDLRNPSFQGAKVIDNYTYQIKVMGKYPQFIYWLAMRFFSPMPWEAEAFYAQPGLIKKNIVLDWYPVGTGPYVLAVNNPNRQMILEKNPNFRDEYYPTQGMPQDEAAGLLANAGKKLPLIDKIVFNLEKESIPRWTKFLQGYYDQSAVGVDNFQQAFVTTQEGLQLSPAMVAKKMKIYSTVTTSTFYWAFNMLDPVVGGYEEKNKLLRQAISIALDTEEYIDIFLNGRGLVAQSPIPPGIEGFQAGEQGMNPMVYHWQDNQAKRLSLDYAKQLLARAGYPDGRNQHTGEPLVLNLDAISSGDPVEKSLFAWVQKQFHKLGIELNVRATDYNRFRDKMMAGNNQIFFYGWGADYPDPENFLFLLYGPNGRVDSDGINDANYQNPAYDRLYEKLRYLDSGPQKQAIIAQMLALVREDSPWIFGFHPEAYALSQVWNGPLKPNEMASNTFKYYSMDPILRAKLRDEWNPPILWPFFVVLLCVIILCLPVVIAFWRKEHAVRHPRI